jgi:hypothetical protein
VHQYQQHNSNAVAAAEEHDSSILAAIVSTGIVSTAVAA